MRVRVLSICFSQELVGYSESITHFPLRSCPYRPVPPLASPPAPSTHLPALLSWSLVAEAPRVAMVKEKRMEGWAARPARARATRAAMSA